MAGVRVGEEKVELVRTELLGESGDLAGDLALHVVVAFAQLHELHQVAGAPLQAIPGRNQLPILGGLAGDLAGAPGLIPRARPGELGV